METNMSFGKCGGEKKGSFGLIFSIKYKQRSSTERVGEKGNWSFQGSEIVHCFQQE